MPLVLAVRRPRALRSGAAVDGSTNSISSGTPIASSSVATAAGVGATVELA